MNSSTLARADLVSVFGWRLLLAVSAVAGLLHMVAAGYYVVTLVLCVALALVLLDIWRLAARSQGLTTVRLQESAPAVTQKLERALALLDTVSVALFLLDADGRVRFTNRAGRMLAGFEVAWLCDVPLLGKDRASVILSLPPGGRQIMALADGRSMLVWVESLVGPDAGVGQLVSIQAVAGELDAVQVGAWHMMTRILSHEMMNSLTPIVSLAESASHLMEPDQDPRIADAVATIGRRSEHLMRFVERYRSIVDLPSPDLAAVDIDSFLRDIDHLVGDGMRKRGIDFSVGSSEPDQHMLADRALLEHAVINLIKNASDAVVSTQNPRIRLSCIRGRGRMRISVSDNGPGVCGEQFEEIFVPFFTTKKDGAGIGLTLARQIAIAHGGRLSVRKPNTGGAVFDLELGVP